MPSGRLTIAIDGGIPVRQASFGDTKTIDLANRLPVLLQEVELRAANSEERRLQAEREATDRRRRWERIRDEAVVSLREDHRAQVLAKQADQWRQARMLGEYLNAMHAHITTLTEEGREAAQAWLTWAQGYVTTLNGRLAVPPDPQPTPDALKPFMRGHSPYGPDR